MGCSSKIHRIRRGSASSLPPAIGSLPIPNSLIWPQEIRDWFRDVLGESGPFTVLIFHRGNLGGMYLQDAVTAAALLEVEDAEWHTEGGYPAFEFPAEKIAAFERRLTLCGYSVRIVPMTTSGTEVRAHSRAEVIDIARGRDQVTPARRPEGAA